MKIVMNGRTGAVRSSFQLAWKMTLLIAVAFTIRAADAAPGKGGGGGRPGGGGGRAVGGGSSFRGGGGGSRPGSGAMRVAPSGGRSSTARPSTPNAPGAGRAAGSAAPAARAAAPAARAAVPSGGAAAPAKGGTSTASSAANRGPANSKESSKVSPGSTSSEVATKAPRPVRQTASRKTSSPAKLQAVNAKLNVAVRAPKAAGNSPQDGPTANPQRSTSVSARGTTIRNHCTANQTNCFHRNWWIGRPVIGWGYGGFGGWGYQPWLSYQPWWYGWGTPSWNSCCSWLPSYGWNQPCYYDYGTGGNVVYQSGQVVVNGETVGTASEYAQSAAELAAVDPSELKATPADEWLPLGTFSMAITESEVDPARVTQLAVSKDGLVSGTIHNRTSGNTYTIQGRVDKDTQRIAFTIGNDRNIVVETGIYNLTQDQTPVLCHFGGNQTQTYFLARLPEPDHETPATPPLPPTPTPGVTPDASPASPTPPDGVER